MMVKSARTKKFDDEIDLIFKNRGLESLGYIQVDKGTIKIFEERKNFA